jgi:hypothetical protein
MAKLITAVVCQRALIDAPSNLVSYIDVFDGIDVPRLPFTVPTVVVASIWQREEEISLSCRVRVKTPNGDTVAEAQAGPIVYTKGHRRARVHCRVPAFEATSSGLYSFELLVLDGDNWRHVHSTSLDLILQSRNEEEPADLPKPTSRKRLRGATR